MKSVKSKSVFYVAEIRRESVIPQSHKTESSHTYMHTIPNHTKPQY